MSFYAYFFEDGQEIDFNFLNNIINLTKNKNIKKINLNNKNNFNLCAAVSFLKDSVFKDSYIFNDTNICAIFDGDLIEYSSIPWKLILENFYRKNFDFFKNLRGYFVFLFYDLLNNIVYIISDHRSQFPVFYGLLRDKKVFLVSSELPSFCYFTNELEHTFLYDYFLFNYPIGTKTFIKNVFRLPPATFIKIDLKEMNIVKKRYHFFNFDKNLLKGSKAIREGLSTFNEIIPKYFCKNNTNLLGLSGGVDSRILLALCPPSLPLVVYTYGIPKCNDIITAEEIITLYFKELKTSYIQILFDDKFEEKLFDLFLKTVYFSGGTQSINRATLLFVYESLYSMFKNGVIISGISGDHIF